MRNVLHPNHVNNVIGGANMDINAIMSAIGSLGFPIVACCAMFWMYNNTMNRLQEIVSENTKVMAELVATVKSIAPAENNNG